MSSNIAGSSDTKDYRNPDNDDLLTDDSDSSDGIYLDNENDNFTDDQVPIPSLIYPNHKVYPNIQEVYNEFHHITGINIIQLIQEHHLHDFNLVRLVNYLRYQLRDIPATNSENYDSSSSLSPPVTYESKVKTHIQKIFQNPTLFDRKVNDVWTDEKWLIPVLPEDPLIMAILANDDDNEDETKIHPMVSSSSSSSSNTVSNREEQLQQEIIRLRKELASANSMLQTVLNDDSSTNDDENDDYSGTSSEDEDDDEKGTSSTDKCNERNTTHPIQDKASANAKPTQSKRKNKPSDKSKGHKGTGTQDNDTYYFDSYAGVGIHAEMLQDTIRTIAYKQAILGNKPWFEQRTVLDVGCGSGILSLFSADAGAARVIALDASAILEDAKKIIALNKKENIIECVRGKAEKLSSTLAPRSVDIIVSEWMGYALHYEGMLASVLDTRDTLLKPGGRMFPSHAHIYVGALSDEPFWRNRVSGWENVYGYNMTPLARYSFPEAHVVVIPPSAIVSVPPHNCISMMNTCTMTKQDLDILNAPIHLIVKGTGLTLDDITPDERLNEDPHRSIRIHGLIMWFDIDFSDAVYDPANVGKITKTINTSSNVPSNDDDDDDAPPLEDGSVQATLPIPPVSSSSSTTPSQPDTKPTGVQPTFDGKGMYQHVYFSTGPFTTPTHWQQTVFLFQEPVIADQGDELIGTMDMIRDIVNPRCYRFRANLALQSKQKGTVTQKREYSWQMR